MINGFESLKLMGYASPTKIKSYDIISPFDIIIIWYLSSPYTITLNTIESDRGKDLWEAKWLFVLD